MACQEMRNMENMGVVVLVTVREYDTASPPCPITGLYDVKNEIIAQNIFASRAAACVYYKEYFDAPKDYKINMQNMHIISFGGYAGL